MTLPKWLLLFVLFFYSTTHLQAVTPASLNTQMHNFRHRVELYYKCLPDIKLRTHCTLAERQAVGKAIIKDGAVLLLGLLATGATLFVGKKYVYPRLKQYAAVKEEHTKAKERTAPIEKNYEELKADYEQAYSEYKKVMDEFIMNTPPPGSPENKEISQRIDRLEQILREKKQKMRASFFLKE